jgi:hypothetical protein
MKSLRIVFGLSIGVAVAAAACSSSDNNGGSPNDAGADTSFNADTGPASCGFGNLTCGSGQTCCLTFGSGSIIPTGVCQSPTAPCTGGIPIQCLKGTDCATGQVCCGSLPAGFDAAALNLDAGFDASGLSLDGGLAGFDAAALSGLAATCVQSACPTGAPQLCGTDTECSGGNTCQASSALASLAGGAGDSGALASVAPLLGSVLNLKVCTPPDAGTTTPPDSGSSDGSTTSTDAASEASVSDAPTGG